MNSRKAALNSRRRVGKQNARLSEQTRHELASAALRVFSERGFHAASLRDISAEAGTAHALIRHHFGSKEGAWRAAVDLGVEVTEMALMPYFTGMADESVDPVKHAKAAIRAVLRVNQLHPEVTRMMIHEGVTGGSPLDYALEQRFRKVSDRLTPLLHRLHSAGYLREFDMHSMYLLLLTAGGAPPALHALSVNVLQSRKTETNAISAHIDRLLNLLLPE